MLKYLCRVTRLLRIFAFSFTWYSLHRTLLRTYSSSLGGQYTEPIVSIMLPWGHIQEAFNTGYNCTPPVAQFVQFLQATRAVAMY